MMYIKEGIKKKADGGVYRSRRSGMKSCEKLRLCVMFVKNEECHSRKVRTEKHFGGEGSRVVFH